MASHSSDDDGIRTGGPPPPDSTEQTIRLVVGVEEASAKGFHLEFRMSRGRTAASIATAVGGFALYQLLPGQRTFVVIASLITVIVWMLVPRRWAERLAEREDRRRT